MILVLSATKLLNTVLLQVVSWDGTTMHPKMLKGLENLLRATDSLYNYSCYSLLMECRLKLVQAYCLNRTFIHVVQVQYVSGLGTLQVVCMTCSCQCLLLGCLSDTDLCRRSPVYGWRGMGFGQIAINKSHYESICIEITCPLATIACMQHEYSLVNTTSCKL